MTGMSEDQIQQNLKSMSGWSLEDGQIARTYEFDTFLNGIEFVRKVANAAEEADHHPDIDIRYSEIKIALSSHDVGGITDRDFNLAKKIDELA